jgi:hypothetical protein
MFSLLDLSRFSGLVQFSDSGFVKLQIPTCKNIQTPGKAWHISSIQFVVQFVRFDRAAGLP